MIWNRNTVGYAAVGAVAIAGVTLGGVVLLSNRSAPAPAHSAPPAPTSTHPRQLFSPFTGEPVKALKRVLIVKIGNTVPERPATGLSKADIVYLIPVEGGLSRIMAVFSSHHPAVIGPVRSARQDDLKLIRQFGRPGFAFSGASYRLLPVVEHARIVNLYAGTVGGYFRGSNRVPPYNLYANTRQLLAQARHASVAHNIGFRFGPAPAGGKAVHSESVSFPSAAFRFTWSAHKGRWLVWMDGTQATTTEAGRLGAATVVIEHTTITTSPFKEYGCRPPYAVSVGSGSALVLRNGKAYRAHWSRPAADRGTTFTTSGGKPMTFARGQVWIVLAAGPGGYHGC